jgi:excinuclease UvrABC nuclease subunit
VKTNLYRHFDKDGKLLYVGVSLSYVQRLAQHRDHAHWFWQVADVKLQPFESRAEAEAAETAAIKAEKPAYNIQHSTLPKQKIEPRIAQRVPEAWLAKIKELMDLEQQETAAAFWQWRRERRSK